MSYTVIQIPYGSLASVVTLDEKKRLNLSVWRSVGAGLGSIPTIMFGIMAFVLFALYPLSEKNVAHLQEEKELHLKELFETEKSN